MASLNIEWLFLKIYNFLFKPHPIALQIPTGIKSIFVFILSLVSVIFIVVIVYSIMRLKERAAENSKRFHEAIHSSKIHDEEKDDKKWRIVIDQIKSTNSSDWRLAIIEADNLLDELTRELGLVGDNLGERLKSVNENNFKHLDLAWEAHRLRNRIAHEGLAFNLDYTQAKRAIESYETILRYNGFI